MGEESALAKRKKKSMPCAISHVTEASVLCLAEAAWGVGRGGRRDEPVKAVTKCTFWHIQDMECKNWRKQTT